MSSLSVDTITANKATFKALTVATVSGSWVASTSDVADGTSFTKIVAPSSLAGVLSSIGPVGSRNPTAGTFQQLSASTIGGLVLASPLQAQDETIDTLAVDPFALAAAFKNPSAIGTVTPAAATFTTLSAASADTTAVAPIVAGAVSLINDSKALTPQSLAAVLKNPPNTPIGATTPNAASFSTLTVEGSLALTTPLPMAAGGTGLSAFAKGDLVASTGNTFARVPVGAAGKLLKADNTAAGGVSWGDFTSSISQTRQPPALFATNVQALDTTNTTVALTPANMPTVFSKPPPIGSATAADLNANNLTAQRSISLPSALAPSKGGTGLTSIATGSLLLGNASGTLSAQSVGSTGQYLQSDPGSGTGVAWKTANPIAATTQAPQLANYSYFSTAPVLASGSQWTIADSYSVSPNGTINISILTPTTVDLAAVGANGIAQSSTLAGTVSVSYLTPYTLTGAGTTFLTDFAVGDLIAFGGLVRKVRAIASDTSLTLDSPVQTPANNVQWSLVKPSVNAMTDIFATFYKFGKYSLKSDGNSAYNQYQCVNSGLATPSSWTLEFWFYFQNSGGSSVFAQSAIANVFSVGKTNSNTLYYSISTGAAPSSWNFVNSWTYTPNSALYNSWCHVALQWVSSNGSNAVVTFYFNGTSVNSQTTTNGTNVDPAAFATWNVGGTNSTQVLLDEIRLSRVARYSGSFSMPTAQYTWDSSTVNLQHCENFNLNLSEDANLINAGLAATTYKRGGVPADGRLLLYAMAGQTISSTVYPNAYFLSNRDTSAGDSLVDVPTGYTSNYTILTPYYFRFSGGVAKVSQDPGFRVDYMNCGLLRTLNKMTATIPYCFARNAANSGDICVHSARTLDMSSTSYGKLNGICVGAVTGTCTSLSTGTTVVGSGTTFTTSFRVGDIITTGNNESRRVTAIASDTSLTVDRSFNTTSTWENVNSSGLLSGDCARFGNSLFMGPSPWRLLVVSGISGSVAASAWTLEMWIFPLRDYNVGSNYILYTETSRFYMYLNNTNQVVLALTSSAGGTGDLINSTTLAVNNRQWNHLALTYDGASNYCFYVNGTQAVSNFSQLQAHPDTFTKLQFGWNQTAAILVDSFRVSTVLRYPAAAVISPPVYDFVADASTVSLNRFPSTASINTDDIQGVTWYAQMPLADGTTYKFGTGSLRFRAYTCSSLDLRGLSGSITTGPWTMEGWFYPAVSSTPSLVSNPQMLWNLATSSNIGSAPNMFGLGRDTSTYALKLYLTSNGSNADLANGTASSATLPFGAWYHVALTYSGSAYTVWLNGVSAISVSSSTAVHSDVWKFLTLGNYIGLQWYSWDGYIDSFRVSNTARYSSGFSVPNAAWTSDANTLSLNNFDNGVGADAINGITWSWMNRGFSVVAPAPKFGATMCGVNTMSYPRVWVGPTQYQSVTNWTMEFWVFMLATGDIGTNYNPIMETKTQQLLIRMDYAQLTGLYYVGSTWYRGTTVIGAGAWTHLAIVFDGSAYNFYVNGAQDRVVTTSSNYWLDLQNISLLASPTNNTCVQGFVDEFRLSSTARYSGAFAPPASAFAADAATISLNHFDGTADSVYDLNLLDDLNNLAVQFTDTTTGGAFYTVADASTLLSTSKAKFGGSSLQLPNASSYFSLYNLVAPTRVPTNALTPTSTNSMQGAWTIELWAHPTSLGSYNTLLQGRFNGNYQGILLQFNGNTNSLVLSLTSTPDATSNASAAQWTIAYQVGATALTLNAWSHVAVVFTGSRYLMFVNGAVAATVVSSLALPQVTWNLLTVGDRATAGWLGYVDELRVSSVARYASAFTPATLPFVADVFTQLLYHFDGANRAQVFANSASSAVVATSTDAPPFGGFGRFGKGLFLINQQLNVAVPAPSNQWTIEFWAYPITANSYTIMCGTYNGYVQGLFMQQSGTSANLYFGATTLANLNDNATGAQWDIISSSSGATVPLNTWTHIALVYTGKAYYMFGNGYLTSTINSSKKINSNFWKQITFGPNWNGYLDSVRISNTARYLYAFMPLTTPHAYDSFTLYLNNFEGAPVQPQTTSSAADLAAASGSNAVLPLTNPPPNLYAIQSTELAVIPYGNVCVTTALSKFGSGCLAFNGGALRIVNVPRPASAWTVEGWFYPTGVSSYNNLVVGYDGYINGLAITTNGGGYTLSAYASTIGSSRDILQTAGATSMTQNAWNHVAYVWSGTTHYLFVNGVQQFATANSSNVDLRFFRSMCIGIPATSPQINSNTFFGFVDCFRVSSIARYTAGFTPSASAFAYDSSTSFLCNFDGADGSTNFNALVNAPSALQPFIQPNDGSSTISTAQAKYGSASLSIPNQGTTCMFVGVPQIPSGAPWTIEMWVYYSSARSNTNLLLQALPTNVGSNSQGINLATRASSNTLYLYLGTDFYNTWDIASAQTSSVSLTQSAWNHVALVFTGSATANPTYTLYVGGAVGITIASAVPLLKETWANLTLSDCSTSQAWNGYIDDFRISTTARYTTAFTPPGALTWDRSTHYLNNFNGSNGSTSFSNSALYGPYCAFAATDSSVVLSTTQFKYGSSALNIPNGGATALLCNVPPPTDSWTVEGWFYASSNTTGNVLFCGFDGASYRGVVVQFNGSNRTLTATLSMNLNAGTVGTMTSSTALALTTWTHVALVFTGVSGGHYHLFIGGSLQGTVSSSLTVSPAVWSCFQLGSSYGSGNSWLGYVDDLRISSTARYTSDFTPSASALAMDSNTLLLNGFEGANGSTAFNASAQKAPMSAPTYALSNAYLTTQTFKYGNASLALPTSGSTVSVGGFPAPWGPWTIGLWVYYNTARSGNVLLQGYSGGRPQGLQLKMSGSSNVLTMSLWSALNAGSTGDIADAVGSIAMTPDSWSHVAVVFTGAAYVLYVNGQQSASISSSSVAYSQMWSNGWLTLGDAANSWKGYLDDLRISNYARYSAAFTPPTSATTSDLYTCLVCSCDVALSAPANTDAVGATYSTYPFDSICVSNALSRFGNSSLSIPTFAATRVAVSLPSAPSSAWTIECWAYYATSSSNTLLCASPFPGQYIGLLLQINSSTNVANLSLSSTGGNNGVGSWNLMNAAGTVASAVNMWHHYAVVFTGSAYFLFVDGQQSATASSSTAVHANTWKYLMLGNNNTTANASWSGYIDEFRVSNTARYSAAFTPQNAPFAQDANTLALNHFDAPHGGLGASLQTSMPGVGQGVSWSAVGAPTLSPTQVKFGLTSLSLGSSDAITAKLPAIVGPWTLEFFAYNASPSGQTLVKSAGLGLALASGNLKLTLGTSSGASDIANGVGNVSFTSAAWTHVAVAFTGTAYVFCMNGSVVSTTASAVPVAPATWAALSLGAPSGSWNGYVDNLRVSSVARYTSSYTVPNMLFQYDPSTVCVHHFDNLSPGCTGDVTTTVVRTNEVPVLAGPSQFPSGLLLWLDASDGSTITGTTTVTQWNDKSGNGLHAVASSGGTGSVALATNAVNGLSALQYAGAGKKYLVSTPATTTTALTYFAVVRMNSFTNYETFFNTEGAWAGTNVGALLYVNNGVQYTVYTSGAIGNTSLTLQTGYTYVMSGVDNGTSATVYINGYPVAGATGITSNARSLSALGIGGWSNDLNRTLNGYYCEFQLYTTALDNTARRGVEYYLAQKWGADYMYQARFGAGSLSVPAYSSGMLLPGVSVPPLSAPSAWTIECWCTAPPSAYSYNVLCVGMSSDVLVGIVLQLSSSSSPLILSLGNNSPTPNNIANQVGGTTLNAGWNHVAVVWSGTNYYYYVNGTQVWTMASPTAISSSTWSSLRIGGGSRNSSTFGWNGLVDEFRVSSVARYTASSFTLPTAAFTSDASTLYLNHFDNVGGPFGESPLPATAYLSQDTTATTSTTQAKFGASSLWFPNTYSLLEICAPAPDTYSPWTIEFWAYPLSVTAYGTLIGQHSAAVNSGILLQFNNMTNALLLSLSSRSDFAKDIVNNGNCNTALNLNAWNHIALVFTGTTGGRYYVFQNGALVLTVNSTAPIWRDYWRYMVLGYSGSSANSFNGYLDELRISSVARYTSAFTPPASAFSPDSSTLLLNHFDGSIVPQFSSASETYSPNSVTVHTQSAVAKFGSALSLGAGIHHNAVTLNALSVSGASPWTVECWAYAIGPATNSVLALGTDAGGGPLGFQIGYLNGALVAYLQSTAGSVWDIGVLGQTSVSTDAWHHVALVFTGSAYYLFVDGAQSDTTANTSYVPSGTWSSVQIGCGLISKMSWSGYVDDFRISSAARYTTAFTPPAVALVRDASTVAYNSFDNALTLAPPSALVCAQSAPVTTEAYSPSDLPVVVTSSFSKFGGASLLIPNAGASRYAMTVSGFSAPPDAWTIELWAYSSVAPAGQTLLCGYSAGAAVGIALGYGSGATMALTLTGASTIASAVGSISAPAGAWNHVAVVFTGVSDGRYYLFVNGALSATVTSSATVLASTWTSLQLSSLDSSLTPWTGYVDDLRMSGRAVYTAAFTPPVAALIWEPSTILLNNFDSPSPTAYVYSAVYQSYGATVSTAMSKFGSASVSFDPSQSQYFGLVNLPNSPNAWTIELWVYLRSWVNWRTLLRTANMNGISVAVNNTGAIEMNWSYDNSNWNGVTSSANSVPLNTWTHLAFVYTGTQMLCFSAGALKTTTTIKNVWPYGFNQILVGANTNGNYWDGFVDDLRISNVARYTAAFSPPTSAFVRDANTIVLNNFNGASGSTNIGQTEVLTATPPTYTNAGSAPLSTSARKFGASSLKFVAASSHNLAITGLPNTPSAWTIEFWMYANGLASSTVFTTAGSGVRLLQGSSGTLTLGSTSTGSGWNIALTSSNSVSNATWTHIAIVGSGSSLALYVNGVSSATSSSMALSTAAMSSLLFGYDNITTYWNGYIDELRVSNVARYSSGFSVQTLPFVADTSTLVLNHFELKTTYSSAATNLNATDLVLSNALSRGGCWLGSLYYVYALGSNKETGYVLSTRNVAAGQALIDLPTGFSTTNMRQLPLVLITSYSTSGNWVDVNLMDVSWHKGNASTQMVAYVKQDQYGSVGSTNQTNTSNLTNNIASTSWGAMVPSHLTTLGYAVGAYDATNGGTTVNFLSSTGKSLAVPFPGGGSYNFQTVEAPVSFLSNALQSYVYMTDSSNGTFVNIVPRYFTMSV